MTKPGTRRKHSPHALQAVKEKALAMGRSLLQSIEERDLPANKASFHVVLGYDLRTSLEGKFLDAHKYAKWTIYVNNAGTLIHVVHRDGDFHIRFPIRPGVKGCSERFIEALMYRKMEGRFVL